MSKPFDPETAENLEDVSNPNHEKHGAIMSNFFKKTKRWRSSLL